jgi:hypothetical protein
MLGIIQVTNNIIRAIILENHIEYFYKKYIHTAYSCWYTNPRQKITP